MRLSLLVIAAFFSISIANAQTFSTNTTPVGMEHNVLFNATTHYTVSQTGTAPLNLSYLFDGKFVPSYTATAPTTASPTVILIEDLPSVHVQTGAWVGWSTRYWEAKNFKIEGYNVDTAGYHPLNSWVTLADYSTTISSGRNFSVKLPGGARFTKLRFTFYASNGTNGRLGVSELFYIHPEATTPYANLGLGNWSKKDNILSSTVPEVEVNDLSVNGILDTKAVDITGITRRLDSGWAETDFNWVGHSLVFGTKPGTYAHNTIEIRPGGSTRGALQSGFKMHHANSETDHDLRVNISTNTGADTYFNVGDVGIGLTDPISKLHVNGDVRSESGFVVTGNSRFTEKGDNLHIWSIADMEFGTSGATSKMILKTNGNLGIGTTDPKNKLSVNGTIWATKVRVMLTDAADWVFEDDYNLRPLAEVENFIKTHKHLPEIPSAEEFRTNDMEVAEMTNKLLQKIEELTLYTIEQEKQLEAQDTELKKVKELENKLAIQEARLQKLEALLSK